ncbi:MAG: GNAT family N-acetyltransferase [Nakamurella sp.]
MSDRGFSVTQYENPTTFASIARPLIAADRGRSTIAATVLHGVIAAPDPDYLPVLVVVRSGDEPVGLAIAGASSAASALVTQIVSEQLSPDERDEVGVLLASAFLGLDPAPAIVTGPADGGRAFAAGYCAAAGGTFRVHNELLLYRLDTLIEPTGVPGAARAADVDDARDLALLGEWRMKFAAATGAFPAVTTPDPDGVRRSAQRGVTSVLWTVQGQRVSLAAHSAVIGGMSRIGPVYTPTSLRGNGYAAAATAAAVHSADAAGAIEVVLFTEAANATSNAVYRRIGFVERGQFAEIALGADPLGSTRHD